jgi:hypothetical protein
MSAGRSAGRDHALSGMLMVDAGGRPMNLAGVGPGFALIDACSIARPFLKDAREWHGNLFYRLIGLTRFRMTCSQGPHR